MTLVAMDEKRTARRWFGYFVAFGAAVPVALMPLGALFCPGPAGSNSWPLHMWGLAMIVSAFLALPYVLTMVTARYILRRSGFGWWASFVRRLREGAAPFTIAVAAGITVCAAVLGWNQAFVPLLPSMSFGRVFAAGAVAISFPLAALAYTIFRFSPAPDAAPGSLSTQPAVVMMASTTLIVTIAPVIAGSVLGCMDPEGYGGTVVGFALHPGLVLVAVAGVFGAAVGRASAGRMSTTARANV